MKLTGVVAFEDLEGGVWVFRGDDGRTYELAGGDRHLKKEGARAELEGEVQAIPTAQLRGPVFRVTRYRFL
ncbi:MAG: hypothetical protein IRZ16_20505 [Myxococcaceae bacterium]|nr:hypothetical protein [Myxococcaceae bacterium]